jgi:hypothetical protein
VKTKINQFHGIKGYTHLRKIDKNISLIIKNKKEKVTFLYMWHYILIYVAIPADWHITKKKAENEINTTVYV